MDYLQTFEIWKTKLANTEYFNQLIVMDQAEQTEAFYKYLSFGTAGMRGVLGPGTNRMNIFTVRRATQGLAEYIKKEEKQLNGVCIAYDSRNFSKEFALEAALTLCKNGIKVYLYDKLTSVPQLSFSVSVLDCFLGIVITASHNPAKYNGYKVYGSDGGQLANQNAEAVIEFIEKIDDIFAIETMQEPEAIEKGLLNYIGKEIEEKYYKQVKGLCINPKLICGQADNISVIYTPLHGSGNVPVTRVLKDLGVKNLKVVPEQQEPDGNFPTVSAPNPEDPQAFELAEKLANKYGADLMLATDPDCDRLGVAVRKPNGEFLILTGNQIGCLLLKYILSQRILSGDEFAVKSIVSTPLADKIAKSCGVEMRDVLTGFKYIAEQIELSVKTNKGKFLFGFEESFGFLAGTFVRDKDACIAAMLIVDLAYYLDSVDKTIYGYLKEIYSEYGMYLDTVISIVKEGIEGISKIQSAVAYFRDNPPKAIAGFEVLSVSDFSAEIKTILSNGEKSNILLPKADMLMFELDCGRFIIRPSGTEPKLKAYISVFADTEYDANEKQKRLVSEVSKTLNELTD